MPEPPPTDPRRDPPIDPDDETVVVRADEPTVVDERVRGEETYVEEEVIEPPRRGPLVWPWLLALLLVVLGGLGAYWYFTQEDENNVPAVVGFRQAQAEAQIREAGFEPETRSDESDKPRGVVIGQDPEGGTDLEEGKTVLITVSTGPPREGVPDVVGQARDEAVGDIEAAGFDAEVAEVFSDKPVRIVVEQNPAGGTVAKEGSTVELSVSKGGKPVVVSDVVGTTSSEATKTLRDAGFKVNLVPVPSDEPSGTVLAQNPRPGATAKQGTIVRLNVAKSPTDTTPTPRVPPPATTVPPPTTPAPPATASPAKASIPDVVGKELAAGAREFADTGLKVDVRYVPSREPQGRIVAQARPAGSELSQGDTVQLNVSNGPDPQPAAAVPDVTGDAQKDARKRLEDAGFEVLALDITGTNGTGPVLSQTPRGGASVARGSLVILYVGD